MVATGAAVPGDEAAEAGRCPGAEHPTNAPTAPTLSAARTVLRATRCSPDGAATLCEPARETWSTLTG